jgi:hypothetical protein
MLASPFHFTAATCVQRASPVTSYSAWLRHLAHRDAGSEDTCAVVGLDLSGVERGDARPPIST